MRLTPENVRAAYKLLCVCEPFSKWNMPDADDVKFRVGKTRACYGWHVSQRDGPHTIMVSSGCVSHVSTLVEVMAHEMVHLYQAHHGLADRRSHGPAFKKLVARVARELGIDPKRL